METQPYRYLRSASDSALVLKTSPAWTLWQLHEVNTIRRGDSDDLRDGDHVAYLRKIWKETPTVMRIAWLFILPALVWNGKAPLCFWVCFVALMPLAQLVGDFTDDLATALANDKLSGLLSASMGNLVEIIMSFALIRGRQFRVLQLSLLGSVLSNAALVFGTSVLCACAARFREKREAIFAFAAGDATMRGVGLLLLASVVWVYSAPSDPRPPSPVDAPSDVLPDSPQTQEDAHIGGQRASAMLLLLLYVADVSFQLLGANGKGGGEDQAEEADPETGAEGKPANMKAALRAGSALFVTAVTTSLVSEHLTGSLESAVSGGIFSQAFVGAILLPVAGNACEHATAVRFAIQGRAELAIGVSLGSALQVGTFAYPLAVLVAIPYGPLGFDCGLGAAKFLVICAVLVLAAVGDGKGTPQEGLALLGFYTMAAIYFASH
jgi:Ca2+:H+ antiporter